MAKAVTHDAASCHLSLVAYVVNPDTLSSTDVMSRDMGDR